MKNEDRIVELLSEQIKKQDQLIARQDRQEEILNNHGELLKRVVKAVDDLTEVLSANFRQAHDHEDRIRRLEDKMFK